MAPAAVPAAAAPVVAAAAAAAAPAATPARSGAAHLEALSDSESDSEATGKAVAEAGAAGATVGSRLEPQDAGSAGSARDPGADGVGEKKALQWGGAGADAKTEEAKEEAKPAVPTMSKEELLAKISEVDEAIMSTEGEIVRARRAQPAPALPPPAPRSG